MRFTWAHVSSLSIPLDDILSLWCMDNTTQLGLICKFADGALNTSVYVIDKNVKEYWSQHGPVRDTTSHCSPSGLQAIEYHPLDATIQPIPYPLNSPPIKSISLQLDEQDVVGDRVKGLTEVQTDHIHMSSLIY
ncbi:solute carrier family 22 member 7- hypothetical protein [Limosa lapponica baueri]|uniref:Uncharacterized protein n=1 Tax=Limosa lapponica baueri TaxID=1758121 RepID=A0A2I0U2X7_LIMLA|nr:solute carrier family 22 member 7- hypothetical protein [Limosa lapponica baueri]